MRSRRTGLALLSIGFVAVASVSAAMASAGWGEASPAIERPAAAQPELRASDNAKRAGFDRSARYHVPRVLPATAYEVDASPSQAGAVAASSAAREEAPLSIPFEMASDAPAATLEPVQALSPSAPISVTMTAGEEVQVAASTPTPRPMPTAIQPTATPRPPPPPTPTRTPPPAPVAVSLTNLEQELYLTHNQTRGLAGAHSLYLDATLVRIARERATDMATKNYFAHTSPSGHTAFASMQAYGFSATASGENVARNNYPAGQSAGEAMVAFMKSPAHKENLLDPKYTMIGIGYAAGADGMNYYAVLFAVR